MLLSELHFYLVSYLKKYKMEIEIYEWIFYLVQSLK